MFRRLKTSTHANLQQKNKKKQQQKIRGMKQCPLHRGGDGRSRERVDRGLEEREAASTAVFLGGTVRPGRRQKTTTTVTEGL